MSIQDKLKQEADLLEAALRGEEVAAASAWQKYKGYVYTFLAGIAAGLILGHVL